MIGAFSSMPSAATMGSFSSPPIQGSRLILSERESEKNRKTTRAAVVDAVRIPHTIERTVMLNAGSDLCAPRL